MILPTTDVSEIVPVKSTFLRKLRTGATVFIHKCEICGANAVFGYGVIFKELKPGTWRCGAHRL